jgi:hypothetical protein
MCSLLSFNSNIGNELQLPFSLAIHEDEYPNPDELQQNCTNNGESSFSTFEMTTVDGLVMRLLNNFFVLNKIHFYSLAYFQILLLLNRCFPFQTKKIIGIALLE